MFAGWHSSADSFWMYPSASAWLEKAADKSLRRVVDQTRARGLPLRVTAVGASQAVEGAYLTLADPDGHLRERYGVRAGGAAYLLRPDQHVCARWISLDAARLQSALDTALASQGERA